MTINRVMIATAASINGDASGTYRSAISQYFRGMGQRQGKERLLDLPETMLLRVTTELSSGNLDLRDAAKRAMGLFPYIADIAVGKLGAGAGDDEHVYAVDAFGRVGGELRRTGFVCEGNKVLGDCVLALARAGWPNVRIVNLSLIVAETNIGWALATSGSLDEGTRRLMAGLSDATPPETRERFLELIEEMRRRLRGGRRVPPPVNDDWKKWEPAATAA